MVLETWQNAFTRLTDYIAQHPEIKIEPEYTCLPDDVRPEFYRLFNIVRATYLQENFTGLLEESNTLSRHYLKVEEEVRALLGLEKISMAPALQAFVLNPSDVLIRVLFDPLFNLLKGNISSVAFEQDNAGIIKKSFKFYYQMGYEKWAILSLLKLLEADKLFQLTAREVLSETQAKLMFSKPDETIPELVESKELHFIDNAPVTLTLPDLIVHSAKLNKYVATRSALGNPLSFTSKKTGAREWLDFDYFKYSWLGTTLVYVADTPGEVALIADFTQICQPDLIIQCRAINNWLEGNEWNQIEALHNNLKPILGTSIVSRSSVPDHAKIDACNKGGINMLVSDFSQAKLEPIIGIFYSLKSKSIKPDSGSVDKLETIDK